MKQVIYDVLTAQNAAGTMGLQTMLANYAAAALIAALIYIAYRTTHSGPVYSARFNVSLVMLTLITTIIMGVIGNNIALSLGMVGALSIVRFRTAIKDPRDTAYIFWTIAVGICCGVSDYLIAAVGSAFVFFFLILFGFVHNNERILIILRGDSSADAEIAKQMNNFFVGKARMRVHNCTLTGDAGTEYIYEVSNKLLQAAEKKNGALNAVMSHIEGLHMISCVQQDDEMNQ